MTFEIDILKAAFEEVSDERSKLHEEIRRWEAFREAVRMTHPKPREDDEPTKQTENLVRRYQETVMDAPDFETAYGDTLRESLESELSPRLAEVLISSDPLTQQRKRELLVRTSDTVTRRERFLEELETEREYLKRTADELAEIRTECDTLPTFSAQVTDFEALFDAWESCEALERRCERLLEARQRQLADSKRDAVGHEGAHLLNEYLYSDLETSYPVLSAVAQTYARIDEWKTGDGTVERTELKLD